jgi:hypothetical protein
MKKQSSARFNVFMIAMMTVSLLIFALFAAVELGIINLSL